MKKGTSDSLYSVKELAEKWGCSPSSIRRREKDGLLKRAVGIPGVWYTAKSVEACEGLEGDDDPMSAFERRKLEARIRELEKRLSDYESQFYFIEDALERAKKLIGA